MLEKSYMLLQLTIVKRSYIEPDLGLKCQFKSCVTLGKLLYENILHFTHGKLIR